MRFDIRPLSPELKEDYLSFFESVEFEEHPHWADCYCYSFHFTGNSEEWTRDKNRSCISTMIDKGSMKGYLVYSNGLPVGWCNVNNRLNYQLLNETYKLLDPAHARICSIVCFLVHPEYRRQGMLQQVLDRIIIDYSALRYEFIEAYPRSGDLSAENLYRGPLDLFTRNGFELIKEFADYILVRLKL
jgi:ribosomal protein S18 acetylase RimI-like enzyme